MTPDQWFANIAFYAVALVTLFFAAGVALSRQVMHAAVLLLPTLLGVAAVFALLGGHLLFAIQILVYAGAINVLIIFAVLLLQRYLTAKILAGSQHLFAGIIGSGMMTLALVVGAVFSGQHAAAVRATRMADRVDNVAAIGELFLTRHLLSFELTGVVLLAAMVGAIILARRERQA
jgi:NADH:ubiquinone oxidoreductase subunit 6 (subunit J)